MDTEKQEESQEVKWTIVVQCVKGGIILLFTNSNELLWGCSSTHFKV